MIWRARSVRSALLQSKNTRKVRAEATGAAAAATAGAALKALRAARPRNLDGRETEAAPAALPGMAPRSEALRFTVVGKRPDGIEVVERAVVFAHGGRVFHAAALGGHPTPQALETFFENLRPRP